MEQKGKAWNRKEGLDKTGKRGADNMMGSGQDGAEQTRLYEADTAGFDRTGWYGAGRMVWSRQDGL